MKRTNVCSKTIVVEYWAIRAETMTDKGNRKMPTANCVRPLDDSVPSGEPLRNDLASISSVVKQLESAVSSLPYVGADGSSECPWAQSAYADKEELEVKVSGKIHCLADYLMQFDAEFLRCQERLKKIEEDYAKLNRPEPQGHYAEAVRREQDRCRRVQDDKDAISVVLTRAKAVLVMSRRRKYPGKEPQQQYPVPMSMPGAVAAGPQGPSSGSRGEIADGEIGGLMSLGPRQPGVSQCEGVNEA